MLWAEREGRILHTEDVHSMPGHLAQHLQSGRHLPGVFVFSAGFSVKAIIGHLELVAHAGELKDFEDAITYVP